MGHTVEKQDDPIEDADGSQVRGTGGEDFVETTLGRHPDDSGNNEDIGGHDDQEATCFIECRNDETCHLAEGGVRGGDREDGRVLTAKVIYDVQSTIGQSYQRIGECHGAETASHVSSGYQEGTELVRHSNCVEQGVTHGHKPVIGHHCQHEHFCNHKHTNKEKLCHASIEGDSSFFHNQGV